MDNGDPWVKGQVMGLTVEGHVELEPREGGFRCVTCHQDPRFQGPCEHSVLAYEVRSRQHLKINGRESIGPWITHYFIPPVILPDQGQGEDDT